PFAEVNRQRLFYEDGGGEGPVVAFSHGLFMDHSMFDPQVEALRDGYRCIAWDERGHGQTGDALEPFTYWDSADDLMALLDAREDIHDRLGEIDVPALVIHGRADASIDLERAERLADGLPHAELAVIEGAGHASNLTHPGEVNPHIEGFLAGLA